MRDELISYCLKGNGDVFWRENCVNFKTYDLGFTDSLRSWLIGSVDGILFYELIYFESYGDLILIVNGNWLFSGLFELGVLLKDRNVFSLFSQMHWSFGYEMAFSFVFWNLIALIFLRNSYLLDLKRALRDRLAYLGSIRLSILFGHRDFFDLSREVREILAGLDSEWMAIFLGYRDFFDLGMGVRIDLGWFAGDFSSFGFGGGIYFILWRAIRIDLEFVVGLRFATTVFSVFKRVPFERGLMDFEGVEELSFWVLPFGDLDISVLSGDLSRENWIFGLDFTFLLIDVCMSNVVGVGSSWEIENSLYARGVGFSYIWVSPPEIRSCDGYKNHEEVHFPRRCGNSLCGDFYYCGSWVLLVPCKLFVLRMGPGFFPASFKMRVRELKFESRIYFTSWRAYSFCGGNVSGSVAFCFQGDIIFCNDHFMVLIFYGSPPLQYFKNDRLGGDWNDIE
ncbi:MAG: hypothetical protein J7L07_06610 [Candidatus Odinarchaeota archaeon]|nr:hypothetical protein [Candidatus Odinarchaeota archaeon]